MFFRKVFLFICTLALPLSTAFAEYGHTDFAATGSEEAHSEFKKGLLQLHNFEFTDARKSFLSAREIDPEFVMSWWGEALTWWHPLWPTTDLAASRAVLAKMGPDAASRIALGKTQRERDYLRTIEILFAEGSKQVRRDAYSQALKRLHEKYPEDLDAAAFYALSILARSNGRKYHYYMQAGAITEEILDKNPLHPGGLHYNIHSYDDTIHAPLGLRAARNYYKVAPSAVHALHMGAHIYYATGKWELGVERNIDSWQEAVSRMADPEAPFHPETFHSLVWIPYAFQQLGQHDLAREYIGMIKRQADQHGDNRPFGHMGRMHYVETRASYVVDTQEWDSELLEVEADLTGLGEYFVVTDHYAQGVAALHRGDEDTARAYLARMGDPKIPESGPRRAMGAALLKMALAGQLLIANGQEAEGLALIQEAAEVDLGWPAEAGPITPVQPMAELLGEIYLKMGNKAEAKRHYDLSELYSVGRALTRRGLSQLN